MNKLKLLLVLKSLSWFVLIGVFIMISIAAVNTRTNSTCQKLNIRFKNDGNLGFIDSRDVSKEVHDADPHWQGSKIDKVKFNLIENGIRQNAYVDKVELFLDHNENVNVVLSPKKPIARVAAAHGDYYISQDWDMMPLSDKYSKRIVLVTGATDRLLNPLNRTDSFKRTSLKTFFEYYSKNKLWQDAIEQIHISQNGKLDLVLSFSEPIVKLGYADAQLEKKMMKLENFYRRIVRSHDLNMYRELDIQYEQQVIARKKIENTNQ